jgi:ABC-2 type transport system permease protein
VRWRGIRAVIRRDLQVALGSKAVVLPAVIAPVLLLVVLPAIAGYGALHLDDALLGDLQPLIGVLPAATVADLPADPALQAAVLVLTHLLAPMVLLVPVIFASVIAADALAGEKERGTLEGLLLTPLSDREVTVAKLLAAWIPATILGLVGAVLYATVANLVVGTQVGALILPTAEFAVMALWVGPAMAAATLGAVLLVSVRVDTTQEAFQIGGVVVLPVVGLLVSQATGALLLSVWLLVAGGLVALGIAALLLAVGARSLSRTRLGERLS